MSDKDDAKYNSEFIRQLAILLVKQVRSTSKGRVHHEEASPDEPVSPDRSHE